MNGLTGLAITKLDVLSGQPKIKIARKYVADGREFDCMPGNIRKTSRLEPVYEEVDGWNEDITHVRQFDDLPRNARNYLRRIEEICGVEPVIISVGPDREETLLLRNPFDKS